MSTAIATKIKALQPKASNRAIGRALKVDEKTIRNDRAEKSASGGKNSSKINGASAGSAEKSAPQLEAAVDAKIAESKKFLAWWDAKVTPGRNMKLLQGTVHRERGERDQMSAGEATKLTGMVQQRVSDLGKAGGMSVTGVEGNRNFPATRSSSVRAIDQSQLEAPPSQREPAGMDCRWRR
jgi:hypothetical protein